jgi:hypothetical protein
MYRREDKEQIGMDEFFLPFEGHLDNNNRWVKLSKLMPWDYIEEIYSRGFSADTGRTAITARIAFGSIYLKEQEKLTDEGSVRYIQENPYTQYFLGLKRFQPEPLFEPSMMVHFRKRFPAGEIIKINEYICLGHWPQQNDNDDDDNDVPPGDSGMKKTGPNPNTSKKKLKSLKKNSGKLLLDATVAPSDIHYPTDIALLNRCREIQEEAIDLVWEHTARQGHKTPYNRRKARKSYLKVAKAKRHKKNAVRNAIGEQLRYVEEGAERLQELLKESPDVSLPSWLLQRLAVIPQIFAQQKEMYENRINKCEDRIVSLHQPHVRPIVRGKIPNPTEFGQKLHLSVVDGYTFLERSSWDNFNEGCDLIAAVEQYRIRFGCYPEAILADQIYRTRENRAFCKLKGIRLSGPPLGRRKKDETDEDREKIAYQDACDRNAVEGRNGNLKRRFGLDRIMCILQESAETEAALAILAMNALHRLLRALLFKLRFVTNILVFQ